MSSRSCRVMGPSCLSVCLLLAGAGVYAQSPGASAPGAAAAADPKSALSDVERAKRDADKVFQWIKFHAEKGETKKADGKPEKHEAKVEARPEAKPQAQVVKVAAQVAPAAAARRPETDADARTLVAVEPAGTEIGRAHV